MYLPASYAAALVLLIFSMMCWGSWANTFKLTRGYRFELFYWDYVIGMVGIALLYALTLGSFGSIGLPFLRDLSQAAGGKILLALFSGIIFNVANVLLVAAIEIAGLAVAFPIGIGLALIIGAVGNYIIRPQGNPLLLFGGVALVALAIIFDALAYRSLTEGAPISTRGIVVSLISGVLMGLFYPFFAKAASGPGAMGPYAGFFIFSLGAAICSVPLNVLLMRRPIVGEPVQFDAYTRAPYDWHLLGIAGGAIWGTGAALNFIASAAGMVGPAVSYALGQGATMVSALWGVFVWREFRGAGETVRFNLAMMFLFFAAGLALVAIAPLR